jgi:hypothetical protein
MLLLMMQTKRTLNRLGYGLQFQIHQGLIAQDENLPQSLL